MNKGNVMHVMLRSAAVCAVTVAMAAVVAIGEPARTELRIADAAPAIVDMAVALADETSAAGLGGRR